MLLVKRRRNAAKSVRKRQRNSGGGISVPRRWAGRATSAAAWVKDRRAAWRAPWVELGPVVVRAGHGLTVHGAVHRVVDRCLPSAIAAAVVAVGVRSALTATIALAAAERASNRKPQAWQHPKTTIRRAAGGWRPREWPEGSSSGTKNRERGSTSPKGKDNLGQEQEIVRRRSGDVGQRGWLAGGRTGLCGLARLRPVHTLAGVVPERVGRYLLPPVRRLPTGPLRQQGVDGITWLRVDQAGVPVGARNRQRPQHREPHHHAVVQARGPHSLYSPLNRAYYARLGMTGN
eukprot:COSAG02_NODE_26_length_51927_cov_61.213881_29_plen_289_part_00